jgi:hypothetical protein
MSGKPTSPPDPRPPCMILADSPECEDCTWCFTAIGGFVLKYINRACRLHGRLLPPAREFRRATA